MVGWHSVVVGGLCVCVLHCFGCLIGGNFLGIVGGIFAFLAFRLGLLLGGGLWRTATSGTAGTGLWSGNLLGGHLWCSLLWSTSAALSGAGSVTVCLHGCGFWFLFSNLKTDKTLPIKIKHIFYDERKIVVFWSKLYLWLLGASCGTTALLGGNRGSGFVVRHDVDWLLLCKRKIW